MNIQEEYSTRLTCLMTQKLQRFSNHIKQIDVHIWEEEKGFHEKHCTLEARIPGQRPVLVDEFANTHEFAIEGAVEKMKCALDSLFGKNDGHLTAA